MSSDLTIVLALAAALTSCSSVPVTDLPPQLAEVQDTELADLTLARSTSVGLPDPGELVIRTTREAIVLNVTLDVGPDGVSIEERPVLVLDRGYIPPKEFQSAASPIAPSLVSAVEQGLADQVPQTEHFIFLANQRFPAVYVTLVFDQTTPFATVSAVMWAASMAGTVDFRLEVESTSWNGLWVEGEASRGPGVVVYTTVRAFQPIDEADETFGLLPELAVRVSEAGFMIEDLAETDLWAGTGLGAPIPGCPQSPGSPTICNRTESGPDLLSRLDFRELYNTLVLVRQHPDLQDHFQTDSVLLIGGPRDLPFEVIVRIADVASAMLPEAHYDSDHAFWDAPVEYGELRQPLFRSFSTLIPDP